MIALENKPRHEQLRIRAYASRITMTAIAAVSGYGRPHVSDALAGREGNDETLDRIERAIAKLEAQTEKEAA